MCPTQLIAAISIPKPLLQDRVTQHLWWWECLNDGGLSPDHRPDTVALNVHMHVGEGVQSPFANVSLVANPAASLTARM